MRQIILAVSMVIIFSLNSTVHAHAVIIRSSLETASPRPNQATEVHLIFNSNIEIALSIVNLVSKGDRKHPLPLHKGRARGEIIVMLPPLPPGEYALQYKMFAADGHLTEDILKFTITEDQ